MRQSFLDLNELYPDTPKVLAALVKHGEENVSLPNLINRLSFELDTDLIEFLEENSYIKVIRGMSFDSIAILPKGKSFLQSKTDSTE